MAGLQQNNARPRCARIPRASGAVSFTRAGHTGIHRLGNASDAPAISLHVYGVPGAQIATHVNDFVRVACQG